MGSKTSLPREVVTLALPAIGTSLLQTSAFVLDRAMLGHYSPTALASMQLAGPIMWSVVSVFLASEVGTLARVGKLVGKVDREGARKAALVSFAIALVTGFSLAALSSFVSSALPFAAPHASALVLHEAANYLHITLAASPLAFAGATASAILLASGDTRTPLAIGVFANAVHLATNRIFIFGAFGISALGARGCAFSMVVTFALEAALGVLFLLRRSKPVSLRRVVDDATSPGIYRRELVEITRMAWPATLERVIYHAGFLGYVGMIASLGDIPMAANQALISIESICFLSADGFGEAAASIVARKLGAEKKGDAWTAAKLAARWAAISLTALGLIAFLGRDYLLPLFSSDLNVVAVGKQTVLVLAVAQPFMAIGIVLSQALRGAGKTRAALGVSLVGALFVRLVFTWLFALRLELGLPGIWLGSTADWTVRTVLLIWMIRSLSRQSQRKLSP